MKYGQSEVSRVLYMFERYLKETIIVRSYHTEEFMHVFEIEPIMINGEIKHWVKFTDKLVCDCNINHYLFPDVPDLVRSCFC